MKKIIATVLLCIQLLISAHFVAAQASSPDILEIHFINVGEGSATLLKTPSNDSILIDTGNLISTPLLTDYLEDQKVHRLSTLILTHPDPDHIGGSFVITQRLKPKKIYDNGEDLQSRFDQSIFRWYSELVQGSANYKPLRSGARLSFAQVEIFSLWPETPLGSNLNLNSLILSVQFGNFSLLIMGDALKETEQKLLKKNAFSEHDLLLVGHHGSKHATTLSLLDAIKPSIAVISAKENYYADDETLLKLKKKEIPTLITYDKGSIIAKAKKSGTFEVAFTK